MSLNVFYKVLNSLILNPSVHFGASIQRTHRQCANDEMATDRKGLTYGEMKLISEVGLTFNPNRSLEPVQILFVC